MIGFRHKFFLIGILGVNIAVTSVLIQLQNSIVCDQLSDRALLMINISFAVFIFKLWALFLIIIYYAKNNPKCHP